jgi:hypothetical protein
VCVLNSVLSRLAPLPGRSPASPESTLWALQVQTEEQLCRAVKRLHTWSAERDLGADSDQVPLLLYPCKDNRSCCA